MSWTQSRPSSYLDFLALYLEENAAREHQLDNGARVQMQARSLSCRHLHLADLHPVNGRSRGQVLGEQRASLNVGDTLRGLKPDSFLGQPTWW